MTRRVVSLVAVQAAVAVVLVAALAAVDHHAGLAFGAPVPVLAFCAAFALVGLLPMHVEFRRSACTVTLVEAVLVLGLLFLPLGAVPLAAVAGEAVACLIHRQTGLKLAYNTVATATSVLLACVVTGGIAMVVGGTGVPALAAVAGVFCYGVASHTSTSAVLRLVEERRFTAVFRASAAMVGVATAVSTSIGLAGACLARVNWAAPLLLAPLVATVALETRRVAAHRAEHLRFERLYAASARTAGLQGFDAALAVSAAEARSLVTGSAAVCCAPDRKGAWRGMVVDDHGEHAAGDELVAAVVELVTGSGVAELALGAIAAEQRLVLPPASTVVLAGTVDDSEAPVALAVFREIRADDQGEARSEVLGAFMGHAALTTTNARLYEEVEEALRHQVDLNRQKDDFLAAVSHELRTPLAAVLGSVATLRRLNDRLPEETKEHFYDMAARQGKRLQRLIEELLMIAAVDYQAEGCVNVAVDLAPMLAELADELTDIAEGRIVVAIAPGAETVSSDEVKLRQVLVNLVENAAKYAPEGRIKVLAWPARDRDGVAITVVDHGPGIPEADRERVFERFVQLDQSSTRQHGGTGLGLYLCKRLTEVIGAELELTETPGGGCTFTVHLDAPIITETRKTTVDMDDRVPTGSQV
jgi:signal transduction histidine kinase